MGVEIEKLQSITQLAQQFGPFLFAILFILFVTRTARGYYRECMTRTAPPSTVQEQKTYRLYFLLSMWAGIAAAVLSIGWWFYAQARGNNIYQIAIVGLKADEKVLSEYYYKDTPRPTIGDVAPMHDTYFLIAQNQPFQSGDRLAFQYFKFPANPGPGGTGVSSKQLEVQYAGGNKLMYRVAGEDADPQLDLVAQDDRGSAAIFAAQDMETARERYATAQAGIRR